MWQDRRQMKLAATNAGRDQRVDLIRHTFRATGINCAISEDRES
jgi:hypothetical protein